MQTWDWMRRLLKLYRKEKMDLALRVKKNKQRDMISLNNVNMKKVSQKNNIKT